MAALAGYARDGLLGMKVFDLCADVPSGRAKAIEIFNRLRSGDDVRGEELQIGCKDATVIWASLSVNAITDDAGKAVEYCCVLTDITAIKNAAEARRENEMRFREITENIHEVFWLRDPAFTKIVYVSPAYAEIWGRSCESLYEQPTSFIDGIHPEDRDRVHRALQDYATSQFEVEYRIVRPDGTQRWIHDRGFPVRDAEGRLLRMTGIAEDVTELKQAEIQQQAQERLLNLFIDHAPAAMAMFDREMRYLAASHRWFTDYRLPLHDLKGQPHYDVFPEIPDGWKELHRRGLAGETIREKEDRFKRADGTVQWLRWEILPWFDGSGMVGGIIIFTEDITDRKRTEVELRENEERLRAAVRAGKVGLWDWNLRNDQVRFSPEWKHQIGYDDDEIGNDFEEWRSRVHPDDLGPTLEKVNGYLQGKLPSHKVEFRLRHKDGSYRWILAEGARITDPASGDERMLGSHIDITEDMVAKSESMRARSMLERAESLSLMGSFETDVVTDTRIWSRGLYEVLGLDPNGEPMNFAAFLDMIHPDDRTNLQEEHTAALNKGNDYSIELRTNPERGPVRYLSGHSFVTRRDRAGNPLAMMGTVQDISELKVLDNNLRESELKYRTTFRASADAIMLSEAATGTILDVNEAFERLSGRPRTALVGRNKVTLGLWPSQEARGSFVSQLREHGIVRDFEISFTIPDGAVRTCLLSGGVNHLGDSEVFVTIWHDVTEQKEAADNLRTTLLAAVQAVALTVEKRDPYTAGHQNRVASLSVAIARALDWDEDRIEGLRLGAIIHDIGKISVPAEILNRPGRLIEAEHALIKVHPQVGYDIMKDIKFPWPVAEMILQHHERMDGKGYPQGLKGDEIIEEARILSVADVVEAMASDRPYRPALGHEIALQEIERGRGAVYDAKVVDVCLKLFKEQGFSWKEPHA